jgi:hypothetical protein
MSRLCLFVVLAAGCAPATRELSVNTAQNAARANPEGAVPAVFSVEEPRRKRTARLAPPFTSRTGRRHVGASEPAPVAVDSVPIEIAAAH